MLCYGYNHAGVIPFGYIAGVTRDGKFAGSMINQSIEIALVDEWRNDILCCEDAKKFLQGYYLFFLLLFPVTIPPCNMPYFQLKEFFVKTFIVLDSMCISLSGGTLMVPQEHREASKFIYNSGFYISPNVYPNFGRWSIGRSRNKEAFKGLWNEFVKAQRYQRDRLSPLFYDQPIYISEVDLVHLHFSLLKLVEIMRQMIQKKKLKYQKKNKIFTPSNWP